jgi:hypothetical protein
MKIGTTPRGFDYVEFIDRYGVKCSIQKSSLADQDCIWLGVDDVKVKVLASLHRELATKELGTSDPGQHVGWITYPIPDDAHISTRMHLDQQAVKDLLPLLTRFAETGELT